jgi:DNA-binding phage protein
MEGVLRTANARSAGVVRAACHAEVVICLFYCWNSYKSLSGKGSPSPGVILRVIRAPGLKPGSNP